MKNLNLIVILIILIGPMSCSKDNHEEINNNPAVEKYVELLKLNKYDSLGLPAFTHNDIPALLKYRNETEIITAYPRNPISSRDIPECKLGVYVLWTIESIRGMSIKNNPMLLRFPSLNPILMSKDAGQSKVVPSNLSHEIAAEAYFNWWERSKQMSYEAFKNIDPLSDTDYRWY